MATRLGRRRLRWRSLAGMGDEELVAWAKRGSWRATERLLRKYGRLVESKARAYFVLGADHEDVVQEGMIGLHKAIRDFSACGVSSFSAFAELCVTRQLITAVKTGRRHKHVALNASVSLDEISTDDPHERALRAAVRRALKSDPQAIVLGKHARDEIIERIRQCLSPLEADALSGYIRGRSYHDIARDLSRGVKQIDNALQRAKRKLAQDIQRGRGRMQMPAATEQVVGS
ncbi:MAG: RNA polymerase sporulation sigma factor SigH [Armatimonadota bacterium]